MQYQVNKPFRADNRDFGRGEIVDPFQWRNGQALINQRLVVPVQTSAPEAVAEPVSGGRKFKHAQSR